jgi:hypothetical protein
MFRTHKPQSPRRLSRKKHLPDEQTTPQISTQVHPMLQMQSLIGNHATQRMIQRMPTYGSIITKLGQPKEDVKVFGKTVKKNSTKYRDVLNTVQTYDRYLVNATLADTKSAIQAQFRAAVDMLNNVLTAISGYEGETGKKATYILGMKPEVEAEKSKVGVSMMRVLASNTDYSLGRPKIGNVIRGDSTAKLEEKNKVGTNKGGSAEVTQFGGSGPSGYFKPSKDTLTNLAEGMPEGLSEGKQMGYVAEKDLELLESVGQDFEAYNALKNEYELGVSMVGIDPNNARMAKRDVAMSRLDQLLGGKVIAKAQMAIRQMPDGTKVEGSLMEDANKNGGRSAYKMAEQDQFYDPSAGEGKTGTDQVNLQDPELMRQLSRLQLIDLLAFQVDRNRKNYSIKTDGSGKVLGIVGIDNDFSMGRSVNIEGQNQELPGMSRYVDEELANAILGVDTEMLKAVMTDLLTEEEIAALLTRLKKLQDFLRPLKDGGRLIKPTQWDTAMAQNLLDEMEPGDKVPRNYYARLVEQAKTKS